MVLRVTGPETKRCASGWSDSSRGWGASSTQSLTSSEQRLGSLVDSVSDIREGVREDMREGMARMEEASEECLNSTMERFLQRFEARAEEREANRLRAPAPGEGPEQANNGDGGGEAGEPLVRILDDGGPQGGLGNPQRGANRQGDAGAAVGDGVCAGNSQTGAGNAQNCAGNAARPVGAGTGLASEPRAARAGRSAFAHLPSDSEESEDEDEEDFEGLGGPSSFVRALDGLEPGTPLPKSDLEDATTHAELGRLQRAVYRIACAVKQAVSEAADGVDSAWDALESVADWFWVAAGNQDRGQSQQALKVACDTWSTLTGQQSDPTVPLESSVLFQRNLRRHQRLGRSDSHKRDSTPEGRGKATPPQPKTSGNRGSRRRKSNAPAPAAKKQQQQQRGRSASREKPAAAGRGRPSSRT